MNQRRSQSQRPTGPRRPPRGREGRERREGREGREGRPQKGKFKLLLFSLLIALLLYPTETPLAVPASVVLFASAFALVDFSGHRTVAAILGLLTLIGVWLIQLKVVAPSVLGIVIPLGLVFMAYCSIVILRLVLGRRHVTTHTLYGTIAVYLLLGIFWGVLYNYIALIQPGAFYADVAVRPDGILWSDLLHLSLQTITTVGHARITPVSALAQALVSLEAVAGVTCIAVLVSRFIAAHRQQAPPARR